MRTRIVIALAVVVLLPTAFAQAPQRIQAERVQISNAGEFDNKQTHQYNLSSVNGCDPAKEYNVVGQPGYTTDAVTGCVTGHPLSKVHQIDGVAGYVSCASSTGYCDGSYFQNRGTKVDNLRLWGTNTLVTDAVGTTGAKIVGYEDDVGPSGAPQELIGITITGGKAPSAKIPVGAQAIQISPVGWQWPYGLMFNRGATSGAAIFLEGAKAQNPSPSQNLEFQGWDNAGHNHIAAMHSDPNGNLTLSPNVGGNGNVTIRGNLIVSGSVSKSGGSFKIDDPLDPANKYLSHSYVESPDMKNIYDGTVITDESGMAVVCLPKYFEALNRDFRYQLTVIGQFAQAIVARKITNNRFVIRTSKPNVEVSWQVTGVRHDAYADAHRIVVEQTKPPHERGKYLHPELFGAPEEQGVNYLPLSTPAVTTAGQMASATGSKQP